MRGKILFKLFDRYLGIALVWGLAPLKLFRRGKKPVIRPGSRVLVIKFSAMGDTLLLLPVLKALRKAVGPKGVVEMVATPVNQGVLKGIAEGKNWLDVLHVIQPGSFLGRPWEILGLCQSLRARRFDVAIDFDQWLRVSPLIGFGSGAACLVGFSTHGQMRHALYDESIKNREDVHEFEQFKALAQKAGLASGMVEPFNGFLMREKFLGASPAKRNPKPLVVLHPGTGGRRGWQREWPVERFALLGRKLKQALGARVGLSGAGPYERELCSQIEKGMGRADEACVDSGLKSLVAQLCRADLLVCGNTGVMHMAAGLGTPLIALHGPNPPKKWGPVSSSRRGDAATRRTRVISANLPCSPCLNLGFEFGCDQRPCMEAISGDRVYMECLMVLEQGGR